jgi:hypothetical protein
MRDFEARDLREKIPDSLAKELAKQEKMLKETKPNMATAHPVRPKNCEKPMLNANGYCII